MGWQPAAVRFPDIELELTGRFRAMLPEHDAADVAVDRVVPTDRPMRLVAFTRDGGASDGVTDTPRVRVRVFDTSAQAATDLALLVVALMQLAVDGTPITRARHISGPIEVPDPTQTTGAHQRYLLFELTTRGVQIP